jgi:hypothetical protein
VTEAELDLGFELLEKADHNLAADIGVYGVVSGAVPSQHAPIADLTIDLSAPGRAYDRLGQRVFFGTGQTVNLAVDSTGIPTDVSTNTHEQWLGVFIRFKRLLSDPRTDGNSQQVFFRRDESFELVVRQGPHPTGVVEPGKSPPAGRGSSLSNWLELALGYRLSSVEREPCLTFTKANVKRVRRVPRFPSTS